MADFFEQLGKKISEVADLEYISLCESIEKREEEADSAGGRYEKFRRYSRCY